MGKASDAASGQVARPKHARLVHITMALLLIAAIGCKSKPDSAPIPFGDDLPDDPSAKHDAGDSPSSEKDAGESIVDAGADETTDSGSVSKLDQKLSAAIPEAGLTGDPAVWRGLHQTRPADDPMVRLGQLLFFSQTLAGGFDASCGTCHHPDFAGADGLSLSVGVAPVKRSRVGPGRAVDSTRDRDPLADGGPNMPRNSLTTFNAAMFDRAQMYDGRVFVLDDGIAPGGHGQAIRTPESGIGSDPTDASGLLEVTMKFPVIPDNELRGFLYTEISSPDEYRERLLQRLRGQADREVFTPHAADNWLSRFRDAFEAPNAEADELITINHVQKALATFIKSQIFVDSPWKQYVQGEPDAIDDDAKRGALLFLQKPSAGGLGCASCHMGDAFTSEGFVNAGFPQLGRGFKFADRRDLGRWAITREATAQSAFRVPSLLNCALTAPYGHSGAFPTLEALLRYHVDPREEVKHYDFTLQQLDQYAGKGVTYEGALERTLDAIAQDTFDEAEDSLPKRKLKAAEVRELIAFLDALTDRCAGDPDCRSAWTPDASLDPDGQMLVRDAPGDPPVTDAHTPADYPKQFSLEIVATSERATFADVQICDDGMLAAQNTNTQSFVNHTGNESFGLTAPHGFSTETWMAGGNTFEPVMMTGGASAVYLDDDCWPDIAYAGGDSSGLVFHRNRGVQLGFESQDLLGPTLDAALGTRLSGIAIADLNGDYRRELVIGNIVSNKVPILAAADSGMYYQIAALDMSRHTFGISFGLLGASPYPSMYLAHWSGNGVPGTAPAFFYNDGGTQLLPYDKQAKTSSAYVDQSFNFTPKFADFNQDGKQDIVLASDFSTSQVLQNEDEASYQNITDISVITDENGMGSALLDFDNDGKLDWFVTAIYDLEGTPLGNWGGTGNRLYRNVSTETNVSFQDVTTSAGVRDGAWGWGACAADFNLDGYLDIFHVNGFGRFPEGVLPTGGETAKPFFIEATEDYVGVPPRLFINGGDGSFSEQAAAWDIDVASEGRGVACFDYDRDGDVDILLLDHSTGLQFFENQVGHDANHRFLNVRVVGAPPNTDALGARVTAVTDVGHSHGVQAQVRISEANSNFNSQNLPDLVFGLGTADVISSLTITWPNDAVSLVCNNVQTNQFLVFDQRDKKCPTPLP